MQELYKTGKVEHPHPYLRHYLGWKRWNRPEIPVLPFDGGWEDWDLEATTAFEIIEELIAAEERRKSFAAELKKTGPTPLIQR